MKFEEAIKQLEDSAKEKIAECKSLEEMLKVFTENGITISKAEIEDAIKNISSELSDDELDMVTGGIDLTGFMAIGAKKLIELLKDKYKNKDNII